MNIGYNPALCNPEAKITPSQSKLHRRWYYHFSADFDSTLQKGTGTLFGTELEVTMWWKIWVHNYKERKRGWVQSFSLSISFLSQFASLVVGVRLPPQERCSTMPGFRSSKSNLTLHQLHLKFPASLSPQILGQIIL
ncbi:uncharacterized protein [Malus domestica]|uniref:uncharacterized protein isoform X4 n=1 Tax=Malus domestica TaxID=3750 RepID=UPI00397639FD